MKRLIKRLKRILKPPIGIVLDTNLFVAAYWNKDSASAQILRSVTHGELKLLYSKSIKKEAFTILKNIKVGKKYLDYVETIFSNGRFIKPREHLSLIKDDPHDNKYLDCAVSGKAKFIISNDKHLLKLGHYQSIRIVRPGEFMENEMKGH